MKIKVLIVEDEMLVAEDISDYLKENGYLVAGIATSAEECFHFIEKENPHIVLMDIRLHGKLDGIEAARIINQTKRIPVVFITSNNDESTFNKAITANPHAFISKPFNLKDIKVAIELAYNDQAHNIFDALKDTHTQSIFIKHGAAYKRVYLADIYYIKAEGSYSTIHSKTGNYTLASNLNQVSINLNSPELLRVHRSFIININNVDGFDSNSVRIKENLIPVSKQYHKYLQSVFTKL